MEKKPIVDNLTNIRNLFAAALEAIIDGKVPTAGAVVGRVSSLAGKIGAAKTAGRQIAEIGETIAGER